MKDFLLVGLGGAIGSMLRYSGNLFIGNKDFPYATLLINITGSFIIGFVIGLSLKNESFASNWKLFLATGICGGFTTFSAFSFENLQLFQQGKYLLLALYILLSVVLGLVAAFSGYKFAA
ncbi:MAG: fluoride efflux transporter CrcB [Ferruginibacter sp.]